MIIMILLSYFRTTSKTSTIMSHEIRKFIPISERNNENTCNSEEMYSHDSFIKSK